MAQIPKGSLVKGPHKPICTDCAIYFSTTVLLFKEKFKFKELPDQFDAWFKLTYVAFPTRDLTFHKACSPFRGVQHLA